MVVSCASAGALLAGMVAVAGSSAVRHSGAGAPKLQTVAVGQVCRVEFDVATIESCGNAGLGDLRFNCRGVEAGRCPVTTALTLENIGDDVVTIESDSGTPGHVAVTGHPPILPGATVTIVPRASGEFVFEIDVKAKAHATEELRVIDVD